MDKESRHYWRSIFVLILIGVVLLCAAFLTLTLPGKQVKIDLPDNDPPGNIRVVHRRPVGRTYLSVVKILDDYFLVNENGGLLRIPPEVGKEMHIWSTEK